MTRTERAAYRGGFGTTGRRSLAVVPLVHSLAAAYPSRPGSPGESRRTLSFQSLPHVSLTSFQKELDFSGRLF